MKQKREVAASRKRAVVLLLAIILAVSWTEQRASNVDEDRNLEAAGLSLSNNFGEADAINVVGGIKNSGAVPQANVVARFFQGEPDDGGVQIGDDVTIAAIPPGITVLDSVVWRGFSGAGHLFLVVDPENTSPEDDETDNIDSLMVCMRDSVNWIRMEELGLCHYASSTMLFNLHGADTDVEATMTLAGCSDSFVGIEDRFWFLGGASSLSNNQTDFEFAGEIRNFATDREIFAEYESYVEELKSRLNEGIPVETNIDQYYLPQVDYDTLRASDSHTGHWIVVTGYTDSSFIINDPGVGFDNLGQDPFQDPSLRGQNVIIDHEAFRMGVESTAGTKFSLLSYTPRGAMPPDDMTLKYALEKNISRLTGDPESFDPYWASYWPEGTEPVYGSASFPIVIDFLDPVTFQTIFDSLYSASGGNLHEALGSLNHMSSGMYDCKKGWNAAAAFYGAIGHPEAALLEALFTRLSSHGTVITENFYDMIEAVRVSGGDAGVAEPYLSALVPEFEAVASLEDSVLLEMRDLLQTVGVPNGEEPMNLPVIHSLHQNYPNPFNPTTTIRFEVPASSAEGTSLKIVVYDIRGRIVKVLVDSVFKPGSHTIVWDGRNSDGKSVSSGTYFLTMKERDRIFTRKMMVLK